MKQPRDSQRGRVYQAEWSIAELNRPAFTTKAEIQAYVHQVLDSRFVVARWGRRSVKLEWTRGRSSTAYRGISMIRFGSVKHLTRLCVLHEIAHILAPAFARHTAAWVAVYLQLVKQFLGADAHRRLKAAFLERRVKTRVIKPRQLSLEQQRQLVERMKQLRSLRRAA